MISSGAISIYDPFLLCPKTNKENDTFLFQATLIDCAHPPDRVGGVTLTLVGLTLAISFDFFWEAHTTSAQAGTLISV